MDLHRHALAKPLQRLLALVALGWAASACAGAATTAAQCPPSPSPARTASSHAPQSVHSAPSLAPAINAGDPGGVTAALAAGADPDEVLVNGLTALMVAAGLGDAQIVSKLLEAGGDVHRLEPRMGASALHKAAQGSNPDVARLLLDAGAFVNLQAPTHGHTPLMDAVWHRRPETVELLLERGANADIVASDGSTAQFWADRAKLTDIQQILTRFAEAKRRRQAGLALLAAAKDGKLAKVKALLAKGATVDEVEQDRGYSALHWAALKGHAEVVQILLDAGADTKLVGALMKATVGHKAGYMGHAPVLELVLPRGVAIDAQGPYNGYTALHDAIWHGHTDAAKVLIDAGARLDLQGHDGATPLELAERFGYQDIVKLLKQASSKKTP